ncbi:MAG: ATP synthase F1 subunit delta [Bacteroidia bacterium]
MSEYRVASRYAKSLLDLAKEKGMVEAIYGDIVFFNNTLLDNRNLFNLFKSPVVQGDKKFAVLKNIFGKLLNPLTIAFFEIIIRKRREMYLPSMAKAFIAQYRELNGIAEANVKTAVTLNDSQVAEIKKHIEQQTGKKIELQQIIDPNLIGGMVVQIGDKLYDASVSGKLKKAKKELLNTYISK